MSVSRSEGMDVVCGIVVREDGKILICQRGEGRALAGLWEFPGGKIESGESPQQALVRELREELAIEVRVGPALSAVAWSYPWAELRLLPFLCVQIAGEIELREHQEIQWVTPELGNCDNWAPADEPICRELQDLAYKHGNLLDMCQRA
jgi:8-oxo-dGTP diphosphatase